MPGPDEGRPGAGYALDLCGESCPYPVIRTLEALDALAPGDRIEVTTDCPQSYRNIPDEALAHGSRILGDPVREGARMRFLIEVGTPPGGAGASEGRGLRGLFRRRG